jgi:hypothetical protein
VQLPVPTDHPNRPAVFAVLARDVRLELGYAAHTAAGEFNPAATMPTVTVGRGPVKLQHMLAQKQCASAQVDGCGVSHSRVMGVGYYSDCRTIRNSEPTHREISHPVGTHGYHPKSVTRLVLMGTTPNQSQDWHKMVPPAEQTVCMICA